MPIFSLGGGVQNNDMRPFIISPEDNHYRLFSFLTCLYLVFPLVLLGFVEVFGGQIWFSPVFVVPVHVLDVVVVSWFSLSLL